nr:putative integron gene cassette protein [uncultured bacterium]
MTQPGVRRKLYFAHAYGYAGAVAQLLRTPEGRADLSEWIDPNSATFRASLRRPEKQSVLHDLLYNLAFHDWEHQVCHWYIDSLERFVQDHGERFPSRLKNDTSGNRNKLTSRLEKTMVKLADGAFHILFGDRSALLSFHQMLAEIIAELPISEYGGFRGEGILKTPSYIPVWLKHAVYHRDKGRCQLCHRDLTGVINPVSEAQLDHIWPLARSGSNDATNFQLLCARV